MFQTLEVIGVVEWKGLACVTKPTVWKHKATTDVAHFKQARVHGTEVTNKFEIADTCMKKLPVKQWIVVLL